MTESDPEIRGIKIRNGEHTPQKTALLASAVIFLAAGAFSLGEGFDNDAQLPDVPANISQPNQ